MKVIPPRHVLKPGQSLDRSKLALKITTDAVRIPRENSKLIDKKDLLRIPRFTSILNDDDEGKRVVLINPQETWSPSTVEALKSGEMIKHSIELDYDYWNSDEVLHAILPDDVVVPGAFEGVGHIARFTLRPDALPYKSLIGQVILDKHKHITTVVNKTENIDHEFRISEYELMAGTMDTMVQVKETGCIFKFDFAKVYWNSRLQGEHLRLVTQFQPGQIICDAFAGVGPFALPASKLPCLVLANDLNPQSYHYLAGNIVGNKAQDLCFPFNMNAREFIKKSLEYLNDPDVKKRHMTRLQRDHHDLTRKLTRKDAKAFVPPPPEPLPEFLAFDHFIMNLPATSIEFVDAFRGLYAPFVHLNPKMPMIHVHCFSKADDPEADVLSRISEKLGRTLTQDFTVHRVRDVAPKKEMMCVSFRLPLQVAVSK